MEKLAIVGTFFDGYYDIWEDFLELFERNWPDCPYNLYLVNDEKDLAFEKKYNVTVLHAGKNAEYSDRVQTALKNIEAEYYLLLLEDFFIGEKLDKNLLEPIIAFMEQKKAKYYRMPLSEFVPFAKKKTVEKIVPTMEYTVSCQPSIWKKEFLKQCIGNDSYNAWVFEGIYTKSSVAHTDEFLEGCYIDYRNILCLWHGALQSKFLNRTFEHFQNQGYTFKAKMPRIDKQIERKHIIKQLMKDICPVCIQNFVKKYKKTTSIVEKYRDKIDEQIEKMNL